ncbi:MAG: PAS domain S-box protein, partial [Desulfobacula sp.]|nr:PAS domain S-box protein [Desulfobacula sp.]
QSLKKTVNEKNYLKNIYQAIGQSIIILDPEQNILSVNLATEKITGKTANDLKGKKCYQIFHDPKSVSPPESCPVQKLLKTGKIEIEEMEVETLGGLFLVSCTPVFDDQSKLKEIIHIATDITEQKQAEETLKKSEALLRSTQKLTKVGGWEWDVEKQTMFWTGEMYRIHDFQRAEFLPVLMENVERSIECYEPEDRPVIMDAFKNCIEKGQSYDLEFPFKTPKGRRIWVRTVAEAIIENHKVVKVIGNIMDISDQKKLQKEVLKIHKLESIGTLAGGIAHDFNNLLYVVMGNISLAQDDLNLEIETSESLKEAEKACIKAKDLAARLITFSKGGDPAKKMMAINDLLKDMVISVLNRSNITQKISMAVDIRLVNIDEGQIKQVVRNIVVNAKEAMDDNGQLTVSCENIDIAEEGYLTLNQGQYIKISFKDQGWGISNENLEKIFDPYFSTKDMGTNKGQGLGLTVSYSIIQKHGGLITVESEPKTGSTFSVYLPALSVKEPDLQESEEKLTAQKPVKQSATGTGKILLMDDEEAIRKFLGKAINRLGYDVETCIEGKEAVEIYTKAMESKEPFDVVILDLTNKIGMGGQAAMKKLLEINPDVKGIIITGYFDDPVVANFRACGFSGFVIKPTTRDELSKVINEVLS